VTARKPWRSPPTRAEFDALHAECERLRSDFEALRATLQTLSPQLTEELRFPSKSACRSWLQRHHVPSVTRRRIILVDGLDVDSRTQKVRQLLSSLDPVARSQSGKATAPSDQRK